MNLWADSGPTLQLDPFFVLGAHTAGASLSSEGEPIYPRDTAARL